MAITPITAAANVADLSWARPAPPVATALGLEVAVEAAEKVELAGHPVSTAMAVAVVAIVVAKPLDQLATGPHDELSASDVKVSTQVVDPVVTPTGLVAVTRQVVWLSVGQLLVCMGPRHDTVVMVYVAQAVGVGQAV